MRRRIAILGATGSIGRSAARVAAMHPDKFEVVALAAGSDSAGLAEAARALGASRLAVADTAAYGELKRLAPANCLCTSGSAAIEELCALPEIDTVLCAIVGTAGLHPVMQALRNGKRVALASKEVLVCAGELVMKTAKECAGSIIPVDSEHSAIFQCLENRSSSDVEKLILTASGGAFRDSGLEEMRRADAAAALAHPVWSMGPKVTIDSASMMNKALELVEAHHLFGFGVDRLDVLLHPQSIVHSMVEFRDGALLALLSQPDMALPIQYALSFPERWTSPVARLNLAECGKLTFSKLDGRKYPAPDFARAAINAGGTLGAAMNAANEVAVTEFCAGRIAFTGIWSIIEKVMADFTVEPQKNLETVIAADAAAREAARRAAEQYKD